MQRFKRVNFKKGNEAVDKYVGIIYEIHQQSEKRRATKSITTIEVKNNASRSLGWVMKRLKIVKGRFPYYHWIGGEPNRKMARDILTEMNRLNAKNLKDKPVKAETKPIPKSKYTEQQKEKNKTVAKKKLILAFECGAKNVAEACKITKFPEKMFYVFMALDDNFAADIARAVANNKPKAKAHPQPQPKPQPKPKAQQKPRTISMFWGLIKINY